MRRCLTYTALIIWTTYGSWLPGDPRGWNDRTTGVQPGKPLLEEWCREKMSADAVLLKPHDRTTVQSACAEHCEFRGWNLLAVNARSNHVHVIVSSTAAPQTVRDQLKANCTRRLRRQPDPLICERTWTRGTHCRLLDRQQDIDAAVTYVLEAQDRKWRDDL